LKALSDSDYLERDRQAYNTTRFDRNILWAERKGKCYAKSTLDVLFDRIEAREKAEKHAKRVALANLALSKLTKVQCRRYLLYHVKGLTMREIADVERVSFVAIAYSLEQCEKKIKKVLKDA
jgi:DNA-directed RNA polymerase specialized sigma24 family protein